MLVREVEEDFPIVAGRRLPLRRGRGFLLGGLIGLAAFVAIEMSVDRLMRK